MQKSLKWISIVLITVTLITSIPILSSAKTYSDVSSSHWAYNAIHDVTDQGVLDTGGGQFYPNQYVTRGEAVKALYQFVHAMPAPSNTTIPFNDVPSNYTPYVKWAYSKEITSGVTETSFAPNRNVTKQDMCLLIANTYRAYGISFTYSRLYTPFNDDSSISYWACDAVISLYRQFIVNGDSNNNFNPRSNITKAMYAVMLHQLYEYNFFSSITPVKQRKNWNWCWAACASMVGSYGVIDPPMPQEQIVIHIKGWEENSGVNLTQQANAARFASNNTKQFTITYSPLTSGQVWSKIKRNNPIIVSTTLTEEPNPDHAMVVLGYSYTNSSVFLFYCNPQYGVIDKEVYDDFVDGTGNGYEWQESIYKEIS